LLSTCGSLARRVGIDQAHDVGPDCERANPAEDKRYTDRAAALLAEALDRGFHDLIYPEHNRMPDDPALAPVLQHLRVRALLSRQP
jgi:hypothetical protein